MVDITLFELHLDGAEFTANAPNSGMPDEEADQDSESSGAPLGLFAVVVLIVLLVVAVAAKKMGGSDEDDAIVE